MRTIRLDCSLFRIIINLLIYKKNKVEFFDEMYVFRKDRNLDSLNKIENNMMFEVKESILDGNKLELYFAFCDEEFISGEKVA